MDQEDSFSKGKAGPAKPDGESMGVFDCACHAVEAQRIATEKCYVERQARRRAEYGFGEYGFKHRTQ